MMRRCGSEADFQVSLASGAGGLEGRFGRRDSDFWTLKPDFNRSTRLLVLLPSF